MSLLGKLSPLGVNVLGSLVLNNTFKAGAGVTAYSGSSSSDGAVITETILQTMLNTNSLAATKLTGATGHTLTSGTIANLVAVGTSFPALHASAVRTKLRGLSSTSTGSFTSAQDFVYQFMACHSYMTQANKIIFSLHNSKSFLDGAYSNMDDLITGDLAGVNLSLLYFGQDLIRLGKSINLSNIRTFGKPSNLLMVLQANNAITKTISLALMSAGLTTQEITALLTNSSNATTEQEKKLYSAFEIVQNTDLQEVLTPLNCRTDSLTSLADLLNPLKLFPFSYSSLTVPQYNATVQPTNSKTYYLLYAGAGINSQIADYGSRLNMILPKDVAAACDAFSISMQQVKHIDRMDIEKLAQVVTNLETTKGLAVNNTTVPTNQTLAEAATAAIATGTGEFNSYTIYDFFGSLAGGAYPLLEIQSTINQISSGSTLLSIYTTIYDLLNSGSSFTNLQVQTLIDHANTEISRIAGTSYGIYLSSLWSSLDTVSSKETALKAKAVTGTSSISDLYAFVDNINTYASETTSRMSADFLEKVANTDNEGGQSLIALMREIRNAKRLSIVGGVLDNDIPDISPRDLSNNVTFPRVAGGGVGNGIIPNTAPPVLPPTNPGVLTTTPIDIIPSSLDVYTWSGSVIAPSIYPPAEAVDQVVICNCDCWDLIR